MTQYFCGILPQGNASAILQIVMGKVSSLQTEVGQSEINTVSLQTLNLIWLLEPIMIHRCFTVNVDARGQQSMAVTHQMLDDPYWLGERADEMPFKLSNFLSTRIMNPENNLEASEITRYENSLVEKWAKQKGIVLPHKKG